MLKWFADRLARTGDEVRKDERGFTLIELLVVVIIIGIIAAIAIPTFLSQRGGAQDAAAESDLRNAAAAQEAYYAENDTYAGDASNLPGYNNTTNVSLEVASANAEGFCINSSHDSSDATFYFDSASGVVAQGTCADDSDGYPSED